MLSGLWYEYPRAFNQDMKQQNHHIILLVDNAPTHPRPTSPPKDYEDPPPPELTNVRLEYLPPNTTAYLQPLDAGIIQSLKATNRQYFVSKLVDHFEAQEEVAPNLKYSPGFRTYFVRMGLYSSRYYLPLLVESRNCGCSG